MRSIHILLMLAIGLQSCKQNKTHFDIQGTVRNITDGQVFFIRAGEKNKVDTVQIHNGKFIFEGNVSEPTFFMIHFGEDQQPGFVLVEPGHTKLTYEMNAANSLSIEGGKEQNTYNQFIKTCKPFFTCIDSIGLVCLKHNTTIMILY